MKSLLLTFALACSSALATQESQMRFTAPAGTVSEYKSEATAEFKNTLVSVKSLDGKGLPAGLKEFVVGNFSSKMLINAEDRQTVLEQGENTGTTLQVSGWDRISMGLSASLSMGPRINLDYKLYFSNAGGVEARDIVTSVDRTSVPQGWSRSAEKALLNLDRGETAAYYSALWRQTLSQPFEVGGRQPIMATPEQLGQKATSKVPQQFKLGEAKLLERTPDGGFRFAVDVDTARYAPELLPYRVKQYSHQILEFGPDGRLIRSSGTLSTVIQHSPETREFQGRKFEVVIALVTTSSGSTEPMQNK